MAVIDLCVFKSSAESVMAAGGFPAESMPNGAWSSTADHDGPETRTPQVPNGSWLLH